MKANFVIDRPANGTLAPRYGYGPFGEVVRASGPMAGQNPFQFSTKYTDQETGLNYYGYRYYNPSTGRWISRDPIGEAGGMNVYDFVRNHPLYAIDDTGRQEIVIEPEPIVGGGGWDLGPITQPSQNPIFQPQPPVPVIPPNPDPAPPSNPNPNPKPSPSPAQDANRGRIQAQGSGVEKSVAWSQPLPPTVQDGYNFLDQLKAKLTPAEAASRSDGLSQASLFIMRAGSAGGVDAPVSRSFPKGSPCRIDIEVIKGRAFVPTPRYDPRRA